MVQHRTMLYSQDTTKPVDIGTLDGIGLEEIMLHELDSAIFNSLRCFCRPDFRFSLAQHFGSVLHDEPQVWAYGEQLQDESPYSGCVSW